jgi:hypothetical protein
MITTRTLAWIAACVFVASVGCALLRGLGGSQGLLVLLGMTAAGITLEQVRRAGQLGVRVVLVRVGLGMILVIAVFAWMIVSFRIVDDRASPWLHFVVMIAGVIMLVLGVDRLARRLGVYTSAEQRTWGAAEQPHAADGRRNGHE